MEITKESLIIYNSSGDKLFTDIRIPKNNKKNPLMIFCHGFKGFKDWGGFPYMLEKISETGIVTVAFNFSYNGTGETEETMSEFTRLNLFAQNTFSKELGDLGSVIDYFEKHSDKYGVDLSNLTLSGHSRGGGIVILAASRDKRVKKLITLASVSGFDRYSEKHKKLWREKGYFEVMNARTKQMMRLNASLLDDVEQNADTLDIESAAEKINQPWLIIHGMEDLAVDVTNAENLKSHNGEKTTEVVIYKNTGHTFGIVHPFSGTNETFESVIDEMINFIKK